MAIKTDGAPFMSKPCASSKAATSVARPAAIEVVKPVAPLAIDVALHQSGALEDLEMLGNRRLAHLERRRELVHRSFSGREPRQDRPPRRIRERGEHRVERRCR